MAMDRQKKTQFQKDDIVTVTIEDISSDGDGIGKADGFTLFIKDAVMGDTVTAKIMKVKKGYGYARLLDIVKPSLSGLRPGASLQESAADVRFRS